MAGQLTRELILFFTIVRTLSGSVYRVRRDAAGAWWVRATNRPNPDSRSLGDRWWPVHRPEPWPPRVGLPIYIRAQHWDDLDHPDRLPGGGKRTSAVIAIEEFGSDANQRQMPACATCGGRRGTWGWESALVTSPVTGQEWIELPVRRCPDCASVWVSAREPMPVESEE